MIPVRYPEKGRMAIKWSLLVYYEVLQHVHHVISCHLFKLSSFTTVYLTIFRKSFVQVGAPCIVALFPKLCMVEATIATSFEQNLNENFPDIQHRIPMHSWLQAFRMPPWVAEVLKVLWWGSSTGWFGLSCPAHCSSSLTLFLSVFVAGFSLGSLACLVVVWTFRHTLFQPLYFPPPSSRRPPSSRLAGYLHEYAAYLD